MKNPINPNTSRILAIAPSTRGFGFAVLEGESTLVDWGVKAVTGDKNKHCLAKLKELLAHYQPHVLVLEDHSSRRSARIRALHSRMVNTATQHPVKVRLLSRERVYQAFDVGEKGTKHALAELLAARFPQELGLRLPLKRRPWTSEDYRMGIFDAVALGLAPSLLKQQRTKKTLDTDSAC